MGISPARGAHGSEERGLEWATFALLQIAVAARSVNVQVIDGPHFRLHDPEGLQDSCRRSAGFGYDGKWAVHPEQLPVINASYTPDQASFDKATALVDLYGLAAADHGLGALAYNGEMVDEASRKVAIRTIKRGLQAGMARTPHGEGPPR